MNLLIDNLAVFTNVDDSDILSDHCVVVSGGTITAVIPSDKIPEKYHQFRKIDGKGRLLMPGLINGHMHFYSTFARGISLPTAPVGFSEILERMWWKLDSSLNDKATFYSALVPSITAIKNGVTSVIDHHASPNAVDGSLDQIEEALDTLGLRAVLCYEVSDRDGTNIAKKGLDENERYIKKCLINKRNNTSSSFSGMVGLHASFTLEDSTLEAAGELINQYRQGAHIHVSEDRHDVTETRRRFGCGVIERLEKFGILGENSIAGHCIHLTEIEKDLLADSGTMVVHNPQSNMNNAVGRTDLIGLLERGIVLGIGTDGMTPDIKSDIKTAIWLQKHDLKDNNAAFIETQQMVMQNNPAIISKVSGDRIGKIAPGYVADMILIDYDPPTPMNSGNFWGHFIFGICDAMVDTSIINGEIVMEGKEVLGIDEEKLFAESRQVAEKVWKRFKD